MGTLLRTPSHFRLFDARELDRVKAKVGPEIAAIIDLYEAYAPGTFARIVSAKDIGALIRARTLDSDPHKHRSKTAFVRFVDQVIESLHTDLDLCVVTLTSPKQHDSATEVMTAARALLARVAASGEGAGGWLARDKREGSEGDGGNHVHGLIACERSTRTDQIIRPWCEATGASSRAVVVRTVRGYPVFRETGETVRLRAELSGWLDYCRKPLPENEPRDPAIDVAVSGALAAPWRAFRGEGAPSDRPTPLSRFLPQGKRDSDRCEVCGRTFDSSKRRHARTCGPKCRKAKARAAKSPNRFGESAPPKGDE